MVDFIGGDGRSNGPELGESTRTDAAGNVKGLRARTFDTHAFERGITRATRARLMRRSKARTTTGNRRRANRHITRTKGVHRGRGNRDTRPSRHTGGRSSTSTRRRNDGVDRRSVTFTGFRRTPVRMHRGSNDKARSQRVDRGSDRFRTTHLSRNRRSDQGSRRRRTFDMQRKTASGHPRASRDRRGRRSTIAIVQTGIRLTVRRDTRTDERVDRRGADTPARRHGRVDGRSSTTANTKTRRPRVDGQRSARADWNDFLTFPRDLSVRNSTFKVSPHLRTFFNPKGRKGVFTRSSEQSVMKQKSNAMSSFGLTCKLVAPETSGNAITFPSFVFIGPNHQDGT